MKHTKVQAIIKFSMLINVYHYIRIKEMEMKIPNEKDELEIYFFTN
jgi:general stress protein 26